MSTEGRAIDASLKRQDAFFRHENLLERLGRCSKHPHEVRGYCPKCGQEPHPQEARAGVTREKKIAEARRLRDSGRKYRDIATNLGVGLSTVYAWVNPEQVAPYRNGRAINPKRARALARVYYATHRSECERCGGDRPRVKGAGHLCRACIQDDVDRRGHELEAFWADGLTMKQICSRMSWSRDQVAVEIHRYREKGYDLPYRYKLSNPRFAEQVVA